MMASTANTGSTFSDASYSSDSLKQNPPSSPPPHFPNSRNSNNSSNYPPQRRSQSSSPPRRPPPQHLEAIQTQRAQASVTFRPVSTTSSEMGLGSALNTSHSNSSNSFQSQGQGQGQGQGEEEERQSPVSYSDLALVSAGTTMTPGQDMFPITPSTLVDSSSPMTERSVVDSPGPFHIIPLSPSYRPSPPLHHSQYLYRHASVRMQTPSYPTLSSAQQQQLLQQPQQRMGGAGSNNKSQSSSNRRDSQIYNNNSYGQSKQLQQQGSQGMDLTYSSSSDDPRFQHLPNLWQVLHRKTLPPVCLFNFYLYMRDYERSSEEVDFWLDVTAHEVLWRLYVRATKRRQALAAAERAEKEHEREAARLEAERWKSQIDEDEDQGLKKGHKHKPSVTPEMYEPHWSAANRYLELTSSGAGSSSAPSSPPLAKEATTTIALSSTTAAPHVRELSSEPITLFHGVSPKSPLSPSTTLGRAYSVSGPGGTIAGSTPLRRGMTRSGRGSQELIQETGGAMSTRPTTTTITTALRTAPSIAPPAHAGSDATGTTATTNTNNKPAANGRSNSTTPRRAMTSGMAGVTKEDLQRSAERIYFRYLIPQAEKPVRIPGAVRQRVAALMDSNMMASLNNPVSPISQNDPTATDAGVQKRDSGNTGNSKDSNKSNRNSHVNHNNNGAAVSFPESAQTGGGGGGGGEGAGGASQGGMLKRKTNLKASFSTASAAHREKSSSSNAHEKKPPLRAAAATGPAVTLTTNPALMQPDQDLGLVFAEAREIVFEGMESYYFPRFLKARAYGNLVHSQRLTRLFLGLFILFVGFVVVLCLIFMNVRPRSTRAWFNLCPILVLFGVSETKWMQFAKVKEPYILMLHRQRALKVMAVAILYTACVGTIFGVVPGHRL
ncbi:hypothetical protein EMPS_08515 [Entomortierella parvispora]|uniref:RGS domain-containing protein n=1 Tax=Entomortierella parvispora TaxID=205924 RepID=A0A9P3HGH7_9FUNG|nr:hypothetical protein EMPS_08515 [Entomortierella parvispora]